MLPLCLMQITLNCLVVFYVLVIVIVLLLDLDTCYLPN